MPLTLGSRPVTAKLSTPGVRDALRVTRLTLVVMSPQFCLLEVAGLHRQRLMSGRERSTEP